MLECEILIIFCESVFNAIIICLGAIRQPVIALYEKRIVAHVVVVEFLSMVVITNNVMFFSRSVIALDQAL